MYISLFKPKYKPFEPHSGLIFLLTDKNDIKFVK